MARKNEVIPEKETGKNVEVRRQANPLATFRQEMDKLMDDFFTGFDLRGFSTRPERFMPQIDVVDSEKEVRVSAELPGMDEKDIDVSLTAEALTIRGEKKEETEEKGKGYYRSERSYGSFSRTIPLPVEIDTDKIEASFKKGVLTVKLPKTKEALRGTRKIAVKTE